MEDTVIMNFDMLEEKNNKLASFMQTHDLNNSIFKGKRLNPTTHRYTLLDVILCYFLTFLIS